MTTYAIILITTNLRARAPAQAINISSADGLSTEGSEEFLELANGCLCCSIKDTGIAAIEKLMQRKGAFDHILLETTGLADPGMRYDHTSWFVTTLTRRRIRRAYCIYVLAK